MTRYPFEIPSTLPAETLCAAISDVTRWPDRDKGITRVACGGPAVTPYGVEPGRRGSSPIWRMSCWVG